MSSSSRTHYDVLGIPRDADAAAIRTAWKLHVQAWHPDRFSGAMREEAERQAVRINEAYSTLRDQSRRAAYDCRLAAEETPPRAQAPRATRPCPDAFAASHRAAAAPVGSPMVAPVAPPPRTLGEHLAAAAHETMLLARRHPRIVAAAACAWVTVLGASAAMHVLSTPTVPGEGAAVGGTSIHASRAAHVDADETEGLAELAEQARKEADRADAELARLMEQDEAAARAQAAAAARAEAAAAAAAARAPKQRVAPRSAPGAPTAGRIVRVMPAPP